ncbi:SpoIIE family protein phosphatase [Romeria aff. gracilis LEGE 07310]|uniref:SpoIIE family protein phosphatase n=1 Tax=Vasconcelosia minhoensis LEGE 07310 TaxID=915328 RepID=A0A8J7ABD2_9CYAN|nr:SpoIIE family protein phosphatase [Romeria gracilis]MBE9076514.1 SpoIIE family protein phosphatase [Romeria aff. gracilis LEGE 07310]
MSLDAVEKLRLLVVDDEPDNLDLLQRTFRRDFDVFAAKSAAEALDWLDQNGEAAIIISDQRMPLMNGTEFLSRTVERFPDTIRIVLTGYTDAEDLVDAINAGKVFKYITKPWNPQQLKGVVQQAAETYRVIKQRTRTLRRALQQESIINSVMTAIRGSLDYESTLQTVVQALGETFSADLAVLYSAELLRANGSAGNASVNTAGLFTYCRTSNEAPTMAHCLNPDLPARQHSDFAVTSEQILLDQQPALKLTAPFVSQDADLATICLYKRGEDPHWIKDTSGLLASVSEQVALAISQAKLYQQIQQQTTQMRAELEVARQIQNNLLHQHWPEVPGIKIQARCQPARQVGGDFYEVFVQPQGDIWLAVGDVSGKGVPAALFMASAISVLRRELSQQSPEPDSVMRNLNQSLLDDLVTNNCFITMVLARYSYRTHRLVYANAGHVYPVVWPHYQLAQQRGATGTAAVSPTYLDVRGVPLGILPEWKATAGELQLSLGDVLLLTSDGITEASLPAKNGHDDGTMLNQVGLWQLIQEQPTPLDLDRLLSHIHQPAGEQEDDQTILSLELMPR